MNTRILFQGSFSRENIVCKFNKKSSRKIDPIIEEKARQIWQQKIQEAAKSGKKMWDQQVYRLEKYEVQKDKCELEFSTIPFSIRLAIMDFTDSLVSKGEDFLPMAVYSSIFIETTDGKFVFGEKSDKYMANRKYSYIGGVFNRSDGDEGVTDPFIAALSETTEELGIVDSDIETFKLLGALRTQSCNVALVFYCRLRLSESEIVKKFRQRKDMEMKNLFFAERNDVREVGVTKIGKESEFLDIFEQNRDE